MYLEPTQERRHVQKPDLFGVTQKQVPVQSAVVALVVDPRKPGVAVHTPVVDANLAVGDTAIATDMNGQRILSVAVSGLLVDAVVAVVEVVETLLALVVASNALRVEHKVPWFALDTSPGTVALVAVTRTTRSVLGQGERSDIVKRGQSVHAGGERRQPVQVNKRVQVAAMEVERVDQIDVGVIGGVQPVDPVVDFDAFLYFYVGE